MDIKSIALILLIGRMVSVIFIVMVIIKQYKLLRLPIDKSVKEFRKVLLGLSWIILLWNIVPITVDVLTLFVDLGRPAEVKPISAAYAFSNSLSAAFSSMTIWYLYRLAERSHDE